MIWFNINTYRSVILFSVKFLRASVEIESDVKKIQVLI